MMATAERLPLSWQDVESLPDLERLRLVLDVLPDEESVASLETGRGHGRNDYPVRAMWRALIAGWCFSMPRSSLCCRSWAATGRSWIFAGSILCRSRGGAPVTELRERMEGPVRGDASGGGALNGASDRNFSRFPGCLIRLEDERGLASGMIESLCASLFEELPDFGRHLGHDGKAIESHSTGRVRDPLHSRPRDDEDSYRLALAAMMGRLRAGRAERMCSLLGAVPLRDTG